MKIFWQKDTIRHLGRSIHRELYHRLIIQVRLPSNSCNSEFTFYLDARDFGIFGILHWVVFWVFISQLRFPGILRFFTWNFFVFLISNPIPRIFGFSEFCTENFFGVFISQPRFPGILRFFTWDFFVFFISIPIPGRLTFTGIFELAQNKKSRKNLV